MKFYTPIWTSGIEHRMLSNHTIPHPKTLIFTMKESPTQNHFPENWCRWSDIWDAWMETAGDLNMYFTMQFHVEVCSVLEVTRLAKG